jgi:hypothetical protein
MSNPIEHELALVRDENIRLRHVIATADAWRETLNLPQQDLGCDEFNAGFANYDDARYEIADLIPVPKGDDDD